MKNIEKKNEALAKIKEIYEVYLRGNNEYIADCMKDDIMKLEQLVAQI